MGGTARVLHLTAIAAAYAASIAAYPLLFEEFRPIVAFTLPTAAAVTWLILWRLWTRDPIRDRDPAADATYGAIVFWILLFILATHAAVLVGLISVGAHSPRTVPRVLARGVPLLLGVAFVAIGNLLPRLRPNVALGIRTSRALADRGVWLRVQRRAGYVAVALGVALAAIAALVPVGQTMGAAVGSVGLAALSALVVLTAKSARV